MLNTLRFFDVTENPDLPWIEEFKDSDLVIPRVGEYVYLGDDGPWKVKSIYHGYGVKGNDYVDVIMTQASVDEFYEGYDMDAEN